MKAIKLSLLIFLSVMGNQLKAQLWKVYNDSAKIFQQQRDNSKAVAFFQQAHTLLKKDSSTTGTYFQINNDIGDLYWSIGQYANAEPFYATGKEVIETIKGKENAEYALSCFNLGRLYRLLGQYAKAETLLIESKNIREKVLGKENADYANSCNNLGIVYVETGRYDEVKPLYTEAMQIRLKVLGRDHIDYAASCNNLAILYVVTGKPYDAEPLYLEAKRIREKALGKEHPFYAASCNNLAALYLDMGQYRKAEPLYLEAKQIRERTLGKEHPDYASSCDNLAILYMDIGNYEIAEALYKEARLIREKSLGTKHIEYAKGCNNLALLYKLLGQFEKSADLFSAAKEIFAEAVGKDHFEYGKCCNNLGAVYMDMNDYSKATPLYIGAKQVWEKVLGKEHPEYAKACHNLALVHLKNGEYNEAEKLFLEANNIRATALGKDHPDFAEGCDNLAGVYTQKGEYEKAIALHLQAKELREKALGIAHPDYLQSCLNLANDYRSKGDNKMALNLYTEAFSSQQALLTKIFRFTTEPEKQAYLKKVNDYRSYFLSFSISEPVPDQQAGVYAYEVSLANKNLIINAAEQLRQIIGSTNDTLLINLYNNWIDIKEQLAFWYAKPVGERKTELLQLEEKANLFEKELVRLSSSFRNERQDKSWRDIQQALQPGEAAVEFSNFRFHNGREFTDSFFYVAVVIRKDNPAPQLITLFEQKQLGTLASKFSFGERLINLLYAAPGKQGNTNTGNSLYSLVWKPLEKSLAGINTVYFSPAGELYKVSFASLPVNSTQVLSDQYNLVQLNTTTSVITATNAVIANSDTLILYGGVQYDADSLSIRRAVLQYGGSDFAKRSLPENLLRSSIGDFNYLSETEKEVNEIKRLAEQKKYTVTVASGINATEESVKHLSGRESPSVVHIATHGFFFPDPSLTKKELSSSSRSVFRQSDNPLIRSGLALAGANNAWRGKPVAGVEDGILTAYEVANMYLPNTKLAVLSACETGLGDIEGSEGVYGLQRSFKMAGAANLVMSLWKVPDAETAEFMQEFYKNIFAQQTIHAAFYTAQTMMKNKYRNEPFKWAAWVMVR